MEMQRRGGGGKGAGGREREYVQRPAGEADLFEELKKFRAAGGQRVGEKAQEAQAGPH